MRDVGLTFPLYITVRNSGDALVTIATPFEPTDDRLAADIGQSSVGRLKRGLAADAWRAGTRLCYCECRRDECRRCDCRLVSSRRHPSISRVPMPNGGYADCLSSP